MATKSPGIYFHEIDNTQFTNPKAITGTVLAVVGYAKKGPIGLPVLLNSWSDFVSTFGKPVEGFYSGLAVYTFLSAKGAVLFTRVADESIAKPSVFVMKNGTPAVDGYVRFSNSRSTINNKVYKQGGHYCFKVAKDSDSKYKYFFIDTPDKVLDKATLVDALSKQIEATPGKWEARVQKVPGLYAFGVELNGSTVNDDGDFFLDVSPLEEEQTIAERIQKRIEEGTNSVIRLQIANTATYSETESALDPDGAYHGIEGKNKKFKLIKNGATLEISVDIEAPATLNNIAKALDKELNNESYGISVFGVQGENNTRYSELVFVSRNSEDDIRIASYTKRGEKLPEESKDLFALQKGAVEAKKDTEKLFVENTDLQEGHINVVDEHFRKGRRLDKIEFTFEKYDNKKGTFSIYTNDKKEGNTIRLIDSKTYGNLSMFSTDEKSGIIGTVYPIKGQAALEDVTITRDIELTGSDKIRFTAKGSVNAPSVLGFNKEEDASFLGIYAKEFEDFLPIMKEPGSTNETGLDKPVIGKIKVDDAERDVVAFISKEKGSGTNNIDVEVWSRTSFDGTEKSYGIDIYVDGLKKQTYEDINTKYIISEEDEKKRFDLVINDTPENGGSPYIKVEIMRGDGKDPNVQLKEGRYHVGKQNFSGDTKKTDDVPDGSYRSYDYAIGNDGIPDGSGSYLFEDAMKVGISNLANKELYDFHILICPDNISQEVQTAQIKLCESREDAITIIDPPVGLSKKAVIDWHNGRGGNRNVPIASNYAAVYWPWCKVVDTTNGSGKYTWVMPSIIMAAQYVLVDNTVGPHMAPAGETNGKLGVIDIEQYPNQLDRDELYVDYNRINPITKFKDGNIVAYGEKTTQRTNSVLTKIHTRRMLLQIKKECREALRGYIFMPNTTSYLGKIKNNITGILDYYKKKGGINFFKVICDETNNPVELRQQDIINVDAIIVPEGTIEQINISLTLNKSAETVTD